MNHVSLVGNLGQDISVEISANGNLYARLSLATHYRDRTTWHNIIAFGEVARHLHKLGKGSAVAITGHLASQDYENDGRRFTYSQIVADYVEFVRVEPPEAPTAVSSTPPPSTPPPAAAEVAVS